MVIDRESLKADLRQNIIEIIFTKVDGTNRVMRCTLQPRMLPPLPVLTVEEAAAKKPKKVNPDILNVFDTDKSEWRSMKYDSIISYQLPYTS